MYIRTKNGVYEVSSKQKNTYYVLNGRWQFEKQDIINQSENIEDLCDEFVGVDKTCENGHQFLRAIPYKCANFWNGGVYGAIWTSKGLIYVAKIDSEGKLVLI